MTSLEKESFLHKVVASSAFLFALLILPVAQFLLVSGQPETQQGQVAGVSTEAPTVSSAPQNILSPAECEAKRATDLTDLDKWSEGKKRFMLTGYETAVKPYKDALAVLTGDQATIDNEKESLNHLIEGEYRPYLDKLAAVQKAVDTQHLEIVNRDCGN